jgi:DNA-binding NtrC family response regulator
MSRILLVEDDPDLQILVEQMLLEEGFEVEIAETMAESCELLGGRAYDLVIADALLPDGTGMAVADKAQEKAVRSIIVTGYCFVLSGETFDRYEILQKPVPEAELIETVKRTLAA